MVKEKLKKMNEKKDQWYIVAKEKHIGKRFNEYLLSQGHEVEPEIQFLENGTRIQVQKIPNLKTIQWIQNDGDMRSGANYYYKNENKDFIIPSSILDAYQLTTGKVVSDKKISEIYEKAANRGYAYKMLQKAQSLVTEARAMGKNKVKVTMLKEKYTKDLVTLSDLRGRDLQIKEKLKEHFSTLTIEKLKTNYYFFINLI